MLFFQSLGIALSMYSAIPMPPIEWRDDNMRWSLACLPVVGVLAGGLLAGWSALAVHAAIHPVFFAAVAVLLPIVLAGGFHMDGFLDAADGIFSRRDRERRLAIMKDPTCGPFAVLCAGGLLLLELGAWCQLAAVPRLLPLACLAPVMARCLTVMAGSRLPYAAGSKLGVLFAERASRKVGGIGLAETLLCAAGLLAAGWLAAGLPGLLTGALTAAAAGALYGLYARGVRKAFGGVTGDLLGFLVELSTLALLLVLALAASLLHLL